MLIHQRFGWLGDQAVLEVSLVMIVDHILLKLVLLVFFLNKSFFISHGSVLRFFLLPEVVLMNNFNCKTRCWCLHL